MASVRLTCTFFLFLAFSLCANLGLAVSEPEQRGRTFFQTNESFDPRMAFDVDFVAVHQHGNPRVGETISTWKEAGYRAGRMFFIGSDAGRIYTNGGFDGRERLDEAEMDRDGKIIECAGVRPYMVPTEGWKEYIRQMAISTVDAGAEIVLPEEPLAHTRSGYSEAFKRIWEERYGTPWEAPHLSPDNFYKANRLKSDLYFELVEVALTATKQRAREMGREVSFVLPIHSLLSHAAGRMLFASGRSLDLRKKGLDGFVGQVWTGPIAWSMTEAEGERMTTEADFFESAYLLYSYFANLVQGTGLPCYLLADPVEDDPQYSWDDYRNWYAQSLVPMLMFPWMNHFEVMPWPDRVFLPGFQMATGTPAPEDYRRALLCAFAALSEIAETSESDIPAEGSAHVGCLVADTLSWQMGGPESASLASVHGLTVPLLRRGIPVQILPLERHADSDFLDRFKVLILSYDALKPTDPQMNVDLAEWVKRGGTLIAIGGADFYSKIDEWWTRDGFASPMNHLWAQLGVWDHTHERFFFKGPQKLISRSTFFNVNGLYELSMPRRWILTDYHFPAPTHLYSVLGKHGTQRCGVICEMDVEKGAVVFCGLPARWFAESEAGGIFAEKLVDYAAGLGNDRGPARDSDRIEVRRGKFLAVRGCEDSSRLKGVFVDILDPNLPVLVDPVIPAKSIALFKDICGVCLGTGEKTRLVFSGPRPVSMEEDGNRTRVHVKSPENTPVTTRVACRGEEIASTVLLDTGGAATGETVMVEHDESSDTSLLVFPSGVEGTVLEIVWQAKVEGGKR